MQLTKLIEDNSSEIVDKWIEQVLASYPKEAVRFFSNQKDRFANPVGHEVKSVLLTLFKMILNDADLKEAIPHLRTLVKIRAVQTFMPSQAISIFHDLKKVVKSFCLKGGGVPLDQWLAFEEKIDVLTYTVFDLYAECREQLYKIRIAELKSGNHIMSDGACPSGAMRRNSNKEELKTINIHSST